MKRDSFIFYRSFAEALEYLPAVEFKKVMQAIQKYALDGIEPKLSGVSKVVFALVKPQITANNKRYENGCKGGREKLNQSGTKLEPNNNQTITKLEPNNNQSGTKVEPNDNVNENDNENVNDNLNNASMQVNKKETNKTCACVKGYDFEDYSEVMEDCALEESVKPMMWEFIKHCQLNGKKITNDKLSRICLKMDFQDLTVSEKIEALQNAIDGGYYDIRF